MFHDDEYPTNAILIEYVPKMHQIDLSNFSPYNLQVLRETLEDMHSAGVHHGDIYPRNMMIAEIPNTDQARVLWIDFDSSQLLPESLSERQKKWIEEENGIMDEFIQGLVSSRPHACLVFNN